jgi:uncharacterized protein (DUF433 family)
MASITPLDIGTLVTQTPGVYGGRPCLAGTRYPIVQIAANYNAGLRAEEIAADYSLPLPHVYAGIAYYLANKAAVDTELAEEIYAYEAALAEDGVQRPTAPSVMPLRLYMDEDSQSHAVVGALRAAGIDVATAVAAGQQQRTDEEQLAFATAQRRALYTANRRDFARIHRQWLETGRSHAGIITRSHQGLTIGEQVRGLRRICAALDTAAAVDLFEYLERWVEREV